MRFPHDMMACCLCWMCRYLSYHETVLLFDRMMRTGHFDAESVLQPTSFLPRPHFRQRTAHELAQQLYRDLNLRLPDMNNNETSTSTISSLMSPLGPPSIRHDTNNSSGDLLTLRDLKRALHSSTLAGMGGPRVWYFYNDNFGMIATARRRVIEQASRLINMATNGHYVLRDWELAQRAHTVNHMLHM
jgi:hypothetical protein